MYIFIRSDTFNWNQSLSVEERPEACEQDFWFGVLRFMWETPNQRVCLLGRPSIGPLYLRLTHWRTHWKAMESICSVLFPVVDETFNRSHRLKKTRSLWAGFLVWIFELHGRNCNHRVCLPGWRSFGPLDFRHLTQWYTPRTIIKVTVRPISFCTPTHAREHLWNWQSS